MKLCDRCGRIIDHNDNEIKIEALEADNNQLYNDKRTVTTRMNFCINCANGAVSLLYDYIDEGGDRSDIHSSLNILPIPNRKIDFYEPLPDGKLDTTPKEASRILNLPKEHQCTRILIKREDGTEYYEDYEWGTEFAWKYKEVKIDEQN